MTTFSKHKCRAILIRAMFHCLNKLEEAHPESENDEFIAKLDKAATEVLTDTSVLLYLNDRGQPVSYIGKDCVITYLFDDKSSEPFNGSLYMYILRVCNMYAWADSNRGFDKLLDEYVGSVYDYCCNRVNELGSLADEIGAIRNGDYDLISEGPKLNEEPKKIRIATSTPLLPPAVLVKKEKALPPVFSSWKKKENNC